MRSSPKARAPKYTFGLDGALLASLTADGLAEHLFDVANQLNRGAELLIDHDEKVQRSRDRPEKPGERPKRPRRMRRRARILRPAWRCWTKATGAANTS